MIIRQDMKKAFLEFTGEQLMTARGETALEFLDTWSEMMERAIDMGIEDIPTVASLTITPAAEAVGYCEDESTRQAVGTFLSCWEYGESLDEWFLYSPPELLENVCADDIPQELLDILPELEDTQQVNTFPTMSM